MRTVFGAEFQTGRTEAADSTCWPPLPAAIADAGERTR